jgi:lysozyme
MTVMMTPELLAKLKRSLVEHEGHANFPYPDSVGKLTIGIGYNLSDRGLPDEWINQQYQQDVQYFYNQLNEFPWFNQLNADRQIVLIDMAFMGIKKFMGFKRMIAALERADYIDAANEMMDSKWADQVKSRAMQLAVAMSSGVYNV